MRIDNKLLTTTQYHYNIEHHESEEMRRFTQVVADLNLWK